MKRDIRTDTLEWNSMLIEVRYEPNWLSMDARVLPSAHLEVCSLDPPGRVLPITETGYRSHFTSSSEVDAYGGPMEYVRAWLDEAAKDPSWLEREAAARQLSLF